MWKLSVLLYGIFSLVQGCKSIDTSIANLADALNQRQGEGCYMVSGIYAPFASLNALLATGGASIESCRGQVPLGVIQSGPILPQEKCQNLCE